MSGSAEEILEVSGQDSTGRSSTSQRSSTTRVSRLCGGGDWVPVARQRGIEQAALAFLDAVRAGKVLSARDALATHELCERVVSEIQTRPPAL